MEVRGDEVDGAHRACFLFENGASIPIDAEDRIWGTLVQAAENDIETDEEGSEEGPGRGASSLQLPPTLLAINELCVSKMKAIMTSRNEATIASITRFLRGAGPGLPGAMREAPTAVVLSGFNVPDHVELFAFLAGCVGQDEAVSVVSLFSHECPALAAAVKTLFKRLGVASAGSAPSLDALAAGLGGKELTVCLVDFGLFEPSVVADLIHMLVRHPAGFKVSFLLGLGASAERYREVLPRAVTTLLSARLFRLCDSMQHLDDMVSSVVFGPDAVAGLGPQALGWVLDNFLLHSFTLISCVRAFRFSMLELADGHPAPALLVVRPGDPAGTRQALLGAIAALTEAEVEAVRRFTAASVMRYKDGFDQGRYLTEDAYAKERFALWSAELLERRSRFPAAVDVFMTAVESTSRSQRQEVLVHALGSDITADDALMGMLEGRVKRMTERQLLGFCGGELAAALDRGGFAECAQEARALAAALGQGTDPEAEPEPDVKAEAAGPAFAPREFVVPDVDISAPAMLSVGKRRRTLLEAVRLHAPTPAPHHVPHGQRAKTPSLSHQRVMALILRFLRRWLAPLTDLPLNELFLFDGHTQLAAAFGAELQTTVMRALLDPTSIVRCECCSGEGPTLEGNLHDTCRAYAIFAEGGKLVNLCEWFEQFCDGLDSGIEEPVNQARFSRAVAELQLLGLLKTTKRKTDHIHKLIF